MKQDREKIRDCWQNLRNQKVLSSTMSMIEGDGKRPPLINEVKGGTYITALHHCLGNLPEPTLVHRFL